MSSTNNVTFDMIAADMEKKDDVALEYTGKNRKFEMKIKRILGFKDAMSFVKSIVSVCTDKDEMLYAPETFDFAIRANTLIYYAGLKAPRNIEKCYEVVYGTELYKMVTNRINEHQFNTLVRAAMNRLEYIKERSVGTQAEQVQKLIGKMDEVMDSGSQVMEQLSTGEVARQLRELAMVVNPGVDDNADARVVPFPVVDNRQTSE